MAVHLDRRDCNTTQINGREPAHRQARLVSPSDLTTAAANSARPVDGLGMVKVVKTRLGALVLLLVFASACTNSGPERSEAAYCDQWIHFTEQANSAFDLAMNDDVFGELADVAPDEVRSSLNNIVDAIETIDEIGELGEDPDPELAARYDDAIGTTSTDYPVVAEYTATTCYEAESATELRSGNDITLIRDNLAVCEADQELNRIVGGILDGEIQASVGFRELADGWLQVAESIPERDGGLVRPFVHTIASEYAKIAIVFEDHPDASFTTEPVGVPELAVQQVQESLAAIDGAFEILVGNDACEAHRQVIDVYDETGEIVVPSLPEQN